MGNEALPIKGQAIRRQTAVHSLRTWNCADSSQDGKAPLRAADWLDISFSARSRYETFDNRFRLGATGSDQQIAQRTRIGVGIKRVLDPFRF